MRLDLSSDARADLNDILAYSAKQWGPVKAFDYVGEIRERMDALARGDLSGTRVDGIPSGLRRQIVSSHVIWFRVEGDRLRVVRVLHQSRDAGVQLL